MADRASFDITVPVRELGNHERGFWEHHEHICHGEAPGRHDEPMRFHLGIAEGGTRLFLFREGHLPQELVVSDLVGRWLAAAGGQRP
jgi:hypothetical protein